MREDLVEKGTYGSIPRFGGKGWSMGAKGAQWCNGRGILIKCGDHNIK